MKTFLLIASAWGLTARAASSVSNEDLRFLAGYDAFLRSDYASCATETESLKDSISEVSPQFRGRARLLRAYCNHKLGYNAYAAGLVDKISESDLEPGDLGLYRKLQTTLKPQIDELHAVHFWVFPYGGKVGYAPLVTNSSGKVFGAFGGAYGNGWSLGTGLEKFSLDLVTSTTTYSQWLWNVSGGVDLAPGQRLRAYFSKVTASGTAVNSGRTIGLGGTHSVSDSTAFTWDVGNSSYAKLTLGSLQIPEATVGWEQNWVRASGFVLGSRLASQTILPLNATVKKDPITGFTLKSFYERVALDVHLDFDSLGFDLSGWRGAEAFGVRDEGAVVYNSLSEYDLGYAGAVRWALNPTLSFKLKYAVERFHVTTTNVKSSAIVGGLTLAF